MILATISFASEPSVCELLKSYGYNGVQIDLVPRRLMQPGAAARIRPLVEAARTEGLYVRVIVGPLGWQVEEAKYFKTGLDQYPTIKADGTPGVYVCTARPEARKQIVSLHHELICNCVEHKLPIRELVLDELYHDCYCDYCSRFGRRDQPLWNFRKAVGQQMLAEMGQAFVPGAVAIAACGGEDDNSLWKIGHDWTDWFKKDLIANYAPQLADTTAANVKERLNYAISRLPSGVPKERLVPVLYVYWSEHQEHLPLDVIRAQVKVVKDAGLSWIAYTYNGLDTNGYNSTVPIMSEEEARAFAGN